MRITLKKPVVIIGALCAAAVILPVIIVSAYFASQSSVENKMIVADNVIEISEEFSPPEEQYEGENLFKKDVSVTNTGSSPCYVRVYADFSNSFVRSNSYISADTDEGALNFYSADRTINSEDEITTFVEYINALDGGWVFVPDDSGTALSGFYYYREPLNVGETTPSLFTYIKTINITADDIDQFDILVYAESTQLTDINGEAYDDYAAAWTGYLT